MHRNPVIRNSILFALTVFTASNATASEKPTCPSADTIRAQAYQLEDLRENVHAHEACCTSSGFPYHVNGEWSLSTEKPLDEHHNWQLSSAMIVADEGEEALKFLAKALTDVRFESGPSNYMGRWTCEYWSSAGFMGISATTW